MSLRDYHQSGGITLTLLPRQAVVTPAPSAAALLLFVWVTFKTFQNVVSLQPQFGGMLGGSNRTYTTATQQNHLFIGRCSLQQSYVKVGVYFHPRPLSPRQCNGTWDKTNPGAFSIAANIHQNRLVGLPPLECKLGGNITGVAQRGMDMHALLHRWQVIVGNRSWEKK